MTRPQRKDYERAVAQQREELARYTDHGITPPEGFVYPEQVPKPIGKYLVSIVRNAGAANEREHKFFTGDGENKSILNQLREQGLIGETLCTVRPARCKGFTRYILS
ncbi:MAG: hypothetical protein Q4E59_00700 [Bacteroidales bacterium]|nr:hypothetical protein [Bacteroidales bacterium]